MKITEAQPLDHYRVCLRFDNGKSGIVDLSHFAGRGVFSAGYRTVCSSSSRSARWVLSSGPVISICAQIRCPSKWSARPHTRSFLLYRVYSPMPEVSRFLGTVIQFDQGRVALPDTLRSAFGVMNSVSLHERSRTQACRCTIEIRCLSKSKI